MLSILLYCQMITNTIKYHWILLNFFQILLNIEFDLHFFAFYKVLIIQRNLKNEESPLLLLFLVSEIINSSNKKSQSVCQSLCHLVSWSVDQSVSRSVSNLLWESRWSYKPKYQCSLKMSGYSLFCLENSTNNYTNPFLAKFWPIFKKMFI